MEDTSLVKKWVDGKIYILTKELTDSFQKGDKKLQDQIDAIVNHNLLIPKLVGPNEKYSNLKEYIL